MAGSERLVDYKATGGAGGSEDYKVHLVFSFAKKTRS